MNLAVILIGAFAGCAVLTLCAIIIDDHIIAWWKKRKS